MIAVVSYGVGNVKAFANIFERHGKEVTIADSAQHLREASHIILPGVGAFDWAMERLDASGLRATLDDVATSIPILGVCVGLQMMFERSAEGERRGLGWIAGSVQHLEGEHLRLPHMGWNDIATKPDPIFHGLAADPAFYFLHSYHVAPTNAASAIAYVEYGRPFVCAVRQKHLIGVQFHPEKSHQCGEQLLLNFASA